MIITPEQQVILDAFNSHREARAAELLHLAERPPHRLDPLQKSAFCLGYTAGIVDYIAEQRRNPISIETMASVFAAALAWRDSSRAPDARAGEVPDEAQDRLIATIDAARKALP